jgi:amino acid adenylation domain-containing protein
MMLTEQESPRAFREMAYAHGLFEAQAARTPHTTAVVCDSRRLSYDDLNTRATALADHLRGLGVTTGSLVAIHLDRSIEMLISVLAVLKAGAAYVPLDPKYPKEMLDFMIEDAQLTVILTDASLASGLKRSDRRLVTPEQVLQELPQRRSPMPKLDVAADDLAYVIYTSGSTGQPKGVEITHGGLANLLQSMQALPGCTAADTVLAVTTLSFDIAALELLLPLTVGARVVLARSQAALDPGALGALIDRHSVTLVQTTPTRWRLLIESGWPRQKGLKALCGGESLSRGLAEELLDRCAELWNMYGPTETTVWACLHRVTRGSGPIPIGRPVPNTTAYVLDARLQPVPIGTPGELCIGGVQVARGYLRRPAITAERFIPDPFVSRKGARLFRTGDLVRALPDGSLEFIGRLDNQLKIRGFRIEPEEVEAVLAGHPQLRFGAVNSYDVRPQKKGLAAYLVFRDPAHSVVAEVRQFLRERLPEHMVPTAYVNLPELPLTPNGKVDRGALPRPALEPIPLEDYAPARNPMEERLAEIWQRILDRPRVGIRDNLFDLGGSSLVSVRLVVEMNRVFKVTLEPIDLLAHPTIERLIPVIQNPARRAHQPALIPIQSGESGQPVFFTWHNARWEVLRLAKAPAQRQPFYISEVPYPAELLLAAAHAELPTFPKLEELAAPHVSLIRGSGLNGPCVIAGASYGAVLAFEVAHQLIAQRIPVTAVCLFDGNIRPGLKRVKLQIRNKAQRALRKWVKRAGPGTSRLEGSTALSEPALPALSRESLDSANWDERWPFINRIWLHIMWHYWPQPLATRGILFRARDNEAYYSKDDDFDGCLGWSKLFTLGLEVIPVSGDHYGIWREPHLEALRRAWARSLRSIAPPGFTEETPSMVD